MNISLYISELLRDYDEVCLSDVGTFYKERISASFNEASGVFSAPYDKVRFRSGAEGDDVLVNYISHVKKISEASAKYFINKFVNSIQQSLASDSEVELMPIGVLKKGQSGLHLIANSDSPAYFGLPAVEDLTFSSRIRKANTPPAIEVAQPDFVQERSDSSGTGKMMIIALILLIIAAGLIYVFNPSLFNLPSDKPISERVKTKVDSPVMKPAVGVKAGAGVKDSNASSAATTSPDTVKKPLSAETPKATVPVPSFEVIGASFALPSEAETYVKLMNSRGIKAKIIEDKRKPKYKISLGSFTTFEAANVEKRRVQNTFNKEAWILTVNDKAKK